VPPVEHTDGRGGGVQPRERLGIYKSFNTLWVNVLAVGMSLYCRLYIERISLNIVVQQFTVQQLRGKLKGQCSLSIDTNYIVLLFVGQSANRMYFYYMIVQFPVLSR
jgi:hypothetical protein